MHGARNGRQVVHRQDAIRPSPYQESLDAGLDPPQLTTSTVRYWSDFNRVFYHPRSIIQLNEYELNSSLVPFERWATGEDLFASLDKEHDLVDRDMRPFIEEADQMQGIQIVSSFDDAWGGFASQYVERLRDEYGKSAVWVWGLQDTHQGGTKVRRAGAGVVAHPFFEGVCSSSGLMGLVQDKRLLRLVNNARTLTSVYRQASLVIPLALPRLSPYRVALDPLSSWHTSAVLATALETALLPSRLRDRSKGDTLDTMTDLLNAMGKQTVATLHMNYPEATKEETGGSREGRPPSGSATKMDVDTEEPAQLDLDFAPEETVSARQQNGHAYVRPRVFSQLSVSRGAPDRDQDQGIESQDGAGRRRPNGPVLQTYQTPLAYPLPTSFPGIFRDERGQQLDSKGAQVMASLTTDTSLSKRLTNLRATVTRAFAVEDREALSNDLAEMADEYHEGWSSGSDEGDDD
jgi:hypothetical protein